MTVILDGILNEIASSFVSLTPRNDGISAMADEFRIYCDEILGSSPRMTQGLGNSRIFVIASEAISGNSKFILGNSKFILGNSKFILGILEFCSL